MRLLIAPLQIAENALAHVERRTKSV